MSEKRQYERQLLLSYFDTFDTGNESTLGYLANISNGGLMLISKTPIQTDVSIPIRIQVPEDIDKTKELTLVAKSVRCIKDSEYDYFNIGFQVESLSDTDQAKFEKLMSVYSLM